MRNDEDRRRELADFLKSRRARVKPEEPGRIPSSRRRTPGLRREEVAERVGVSASWYTWLEQARDIRPSAEMLSRLSQVLRLNSFETNHLFDLAGRTAPDSFESENQEVPDALKLLVTEVLKAPAVVLGARFDLLFWNRAFVDQIFDPNLIPKDRRTWIDLAFLENSHFKTQPEWSEKARRLVAEFRWSVGKQIGTPWVKELVTRLCRESPEFARLWKLHDVQERKKSRVFETHHGKNRRRAYLRSIYIPAEAENLRLVILAPLPAKKKK